MTSEPSLCPHESRQIEEADFYNCIFQVIVQRRQVHVDAEKCGTQEWRREDALVRRRSQEWQDSDRNSFCETFLCKTSERGTQGICFSLWFLPAQNYDQLWDRVKLKPHCMPVSTQDLFWLKFQNVCIWFWTHKWKAGFIVCGAILFCCFCFTSGRNQNSSMHLWKQGKENKFKQHQIAFRHILFYRERFNMLVISSKWLSQQTGWLFHQKHYELCFIENAGFPLI